MIKLHTQNRAKVLGSSHLWAMLVVVITLSSYQISQDPKWLAPPEADAHQNPFKEDNKATEKGKKIYQKLCWTCHGQTGKGDGPAAAALTTAASDYTDKSVQSQSDGALYWKISKGRGEMVSYESMLTEDQRWMLVNYIRELARLETVP